MPEKNERKKLSELESLWVSFDFLTDVKMQKSCHLILSKIRKNTFQVLTQKWVRVDVVGELQSPIAP